MSGRAYPLTPEEEESLLIGASAGAWPVRDVALISLALNCGLKQVTLAGTLISSVADHSGRCASGFLVYPNGYRLELPEHTALRIEALLRDLEARRRTGSLLFVTRERASDCTGMGTRSALNVLAAAGESQGLGKLRWSALRRTAAVRFFSSGATFEETRQFLGGIGIEHVHKILGGFLRDLRYTEISEDPPEDPDSPAYLLHRASVLLGKGDLLGAKNLSKKAFLLLSDEVSRQ